MLATLNSGFESCSIEQIRAALPYLSPEEKRDLAEALEAKEHDELDSRCMEMVASFDAGPLYWASQHTRTENPKWMEMGLPFKEHFPRKSYFVPLFDFFLKTRRGLVPKTRDMMTSLSAMLWATHQAQWHSGFTIVQSLKDTKSQELVEYAAVFYREQPEFLKKRYPLLHHTQNEITWANGGRIMGVPAGENQIRTFHPTCYICDEIAFIPEAEACWNAVHAAGTPQMFGISSAGPGWMAEQCHSCAISTESTTVVPLPRPIPVAVEDTGPARGKTYEEQMQEVLSHAFDDPQKIEFSRRRSTT
jgi:hypothetical protein